MPLLNRARMTTATTGTGTVTLGSAVTGFLNFAEAGAANATQYPYVILDGADFEIGLGTYTSSGTLFSRDTVTASKIGGTAGTTKLTLSGSAQIFISPRAEDIEPLGEVSGVNLQTGTSYTLVLADKGKLVTMSNAAANTLTVPPNSSVAFPVRTRLDIAQIGAGQTTIAAGSGVTINSAGGLLKARVQYSGLSLVKTATDTWLLFGDLTS